MLHGFIFVAYPCYFGLVGDKFIIEVGRCFMICISQADIGYDKEWFFYKIAGRGIACKVNFDLMQDFVDDHGDDRIAAYDLPNWERYELMDGMNAKLRYRGLASFEGKMQTVTVYESENILQINVEDQPVCQVNQNSRHILIISSKFVKQELVMEVVFGPALIMLLTLQGVYSMHGSCVKTLNGTALFIGDSGVGKSTLSSGEGLHWQQLSDDVLPVMKREDVYIGLTSFPQFKAMHLHSGNKLSQFTHSLDAIYVLSGQDAERTIIKRVGGVKALLALIRHTVSAKLFDEQQLVYHLNFINQLITEVPVYELSYPRRIDKLGKLRKNISQHLGNIGSNVGSNVDMAQKSVA